MINSPARKEVFPRIRQISELTECEIVDQIRAIDSNGYVKEECFNFWSALLYELWERLCDDELDGCGGEI